MQAEIVVLGSGTSMGVPTLGCGCAVCTSTDPRNRRSRPSIAVEWGDHRVVIDTGQDFREQALREKITHVDAVLYTHPHADHILGLDDLRPLSFRHHDSMPLYADDATAAVLRTVFSYTFAPDAKYPTRARVRLEPMNGQESAQIAGVRFQRIPLMHGRLAVGGYRFGNVAYLTDMNRIPEESLPLLEDLDVMILDALRWEPHPSHANVDEALGWVERVRPRQAWFTHIAHELDHAPTEAALPPHIRMAYDGLRIPITLQAETSAGERS
ncbi:MBL fold metallo-hydrolase [Silvibacterium dinghuense]|uniref:MBL fold metallo-hydrolase n=1 Tax=Silvibacterium dinghuense TaxID=1560006 RepID=A0A4Q1SCA1_9BACT|nr:MBL fold metallo-hydrolase [Silvibacterium dinghuense]